ncbi:MAG: LysR family transcriptional regulator [Allosphingosinicella sp.]|uniref:LysR family transcriptional regulator n=1 Tax=Allosphingosinicella sp. TaxID=2823234 RepID=UPI00392BD604
MQNTGVYDWGDLRVFVAVARQGSTLAAAHDLAMNQTTVARRVAALEKALGVCLFEKLQSGYRLTSIGRELLPWAQKVEQEAETIARLALQHSRSIAGTIRVTTNEPLANFFLTPALVELGELYPAVAIQLIIEDRHFDLMRGEADVAIRAGVRPTEAGLVIRSLGTAGWSFYCSHAYAERRGVPASFDELAGHSLLGGEGRLALAPAMRAIDALPGATMVSRSNSLTNQIVGVRAGLGIGPLPCLLGDGDPELVRCFDPPEEFSGEVMLITRADLKDVPHIRAFNEFVAARMGALRHRMAGTAPAPAPTLKVQAR